MKDNGFMFSYVDGLSYLCYKIILKCGASYIDSFDWLKNKKTVNPINKYDNKCFQYPATVALNCQEIEKNLEIIPKIKAFQINMIRLKKFQEK